MLDKTKYPVARFIESVRPHKRERRVRIDLLYYRDRVVRLLKVSSPRMREKLQCPRVTRLPDVLLTLSHEQVISHAQIKFEAEQYLKNLLDGNGGAKIYAFPRASHPKTGEMAQLPAVQNEKNISPGWVLIGKLVKAGKEWQPRSKRKRFQQFCIDVEAKPGEPPIRLWGGDLRRAMNEGGVSVGDDVEVRSLGTVDRMINEITKLENGTEMIQPKPVKMPVYEIIKKHAGDNLPVIQQ